MFSREESTRMIAAQGLLDLIIADKQARVHMNHNSESESWLRMSMSEASSSQSASQQVPRRGKSGRNKNLLQELLGLLRRCLSQQVCYSLSSTTILRDQGLRAFFHAAGYVQHYIKALDIRAVDPTLHQDVISPTFRLFVSVPMSLIGYKFC